MSFDVAILGAGGTIARAVARDLAESPEVDARELRGEPVEEIRVAAAGRDPERTELLRAPYALQTLLDELSMRPVVLDGGVARRAGAAHGGRGRALPEPIGELATIHTLHSELQTFGPSFGVRRASFRLSAHVVEVSSADGRRVRVTARTRPMAEWRLGGGVVSTAAPAAALVRLLARGRIDAVGVHPPEACVDSAHLFSELERRGCRFEVSA